MKDLQKFSPLNRRDFMKLCTAAGIGAAFSPLLFKNSFADDKNPAKPATNIKDALKYPRNTNSMPGRFPGKVTQVFSDKSVIDKKPVQSIADEIVKTGLIDLTGKQDINEAWRTFFSPDDVIGLKVNPIGGVLLSTSFEIVRSVISQLKQAGIPQKNIIIWDRREFELTEAGFTEENFPGIIITGTERKDKKGSFYDENGKLYGEEMIDKEWYYWADCEEKYDAETIPYMINEGKYSYFSKIVTKQVNKIINIPVMKNAGSSITLCLKNLAFGAITNTSRLHKQLWAETCAEVCAFPPLRDKVVLNIADGLRGCFQGGPGANPQYITEYKTVLFGTDPVAVDRAGYEIILQKRIEEKIQKADAPRARLFMDLARDLQLGVSDLDKILLNKITI